MGVRRSVWTAPGDLVVPAALVTIFADMNAGDARHHGARSGAEAHRHLVSLETAAHHARAGGAVDPCRGARCLQQPELVEPRGEACEATKMNAEGEHAKPGVKAPASIDVCKRTTDPGEEHHPRQKPGLWTASRTITEGSHRVFSLHRDGLLSSVERIAADGGRGGWRLMTRSMEAEEGVDGVGGRDRRSQ